MGTAKCFAMFPVCAMPNDLAFASWAYRRKLSYCAFKAAVVTHLIVITDLQRLRAWKIAYIAICQHSCLLAYGSVWFRRRCDALRCMRRSLWCLLSLLHHSSWFQRIALNRNSAFIAAIWHIFMVHRYKHGDTQCHQCSKEKEEEPHFSWSFCINHKIPPTVQNQFGSWDKIDFLKADGGAQEKFLRLMCSGCCK